MSVVRYSVTLSAYSSHRIEVSVPDYYNCQIKIGDAWAMMDLKQLDALIAALNGASAMLRS